jgi:hypothetical protein
VDRALADESTLTELRAEHEEIVARGGFGVPTLVVGDAAPTFGPIVDTRITGEEAGEIWDHAVWLINSPHFSELKRNRARPAVGRNRDQELSGNGSKPVTARSEGSAVG